MAHKILRVGNTHKEVAMVQMKQLQRWTVKWILLSSNQIICFPPHLFNKDIIVISNAHEMTNNLSDRRRSDVFAARDLIQTFSCPYIKGRNICPKKFQLESRKIMQNTETKLKTLFVSRKMRHAS